MRCTGGQSPSAHTGIQRLNIPPSSRSQIGDIRHGNDVSARPSVSALPRRAPGSPGTGEPRQPALGTGAEPSRAPCAPRLPAPLPPPDGLRAETPGKGSPCLGKCLARPTGSLTALTCRLHGGTRGLRAGRETEAGPQRRQHRSGARESAFAAPKRVTVGLGLSAWAAHGRCSGSRARAAPARGGGCWLQTGMKDEGRCPGRTGPAGALRAAVAALPGGAGAGAVPRRQAALRGRRWGCGGGERGRAKPERDGRRERGEARRWSGEQPAPSQVPAGRRQRLR